MRLLLLPLIALAPLALSGCPSLGTLLADRDDVEIVYDLAYLDDDNHAHRLDLYSPNDAGPDTPVIVFLHGGYWAEQDKQYYEGVTGLYGNVGVAFARDGVRVANTNYRLSGEASLQEMLDDVDRATTFIRSRFPSAPIVLMGHSAGAHLASAAVLLDDGPQTPVDGLVLVSGVYDIVQAIDVDSEENREKYLYPLFGTDRAQQAQASTLPALLTTSIATVVAAGTSDLRGVEADFDTLIKARNEDSVFEFVQVAGADHAATALQFGGGEDRITAAVLKHFRATGIL